MASQSGGGHDAAAPSPPLLTWLVLGLLAVTALGLVSVRFTQNPDWDRPGALRALPDDGVASPAAEPEMEDEYWPCSDCHEGETVTNEPRALEEEHDALVLSHGDLWCLDCHEMVNRDRLRLASGATVSFDETWRLCTQCHGNKLDDWRAGVHGKQTGSWRGDREYAACVSCHDPHKPTFKAIKPKPAPHPPEAPHGSN